jgi:hypothetical protein
MCDPILYTGPDSGPDAGTSRPNSESDNYEFANGETINIADLKAINIAFKGPVFLSYSITNDQLTDSESISCPKYEPVYFPEHPPIRCTNNTAIDFPQCESIDFPHGTTIHFPPIDFPEC